MKYGESSFDILYLLFAVISGIIILVKGSGKNEKLMGLSSLILGAGDAFHLVPRVMNYFSSGDMTAALGIGKLITSITMTVFYVLLYFIWSCVFGKERKKGELLAIFGLTALRIILCLFPQNDWINNGTDMIWGIIRNIPFVFLGADICILFFKTRSENRRFRFIWLYILLSFLFYIPVAVFAGIVPILGMLMLPKTICYILMIITFLLVTFKDKDTGRSSKTAAK